MNATIKTNKPIIFAAFPDGIKAYEVIMETEQSYFARYTLDSGRYFESCFDKSFKWIFTDYNQALEFLNTERDENKY